MTMTQTINQNKYYVVSDLALSTFLSLFFPIEKIDRSNPYKAQFSFLKTKELDSFVTAYWRGEVKVNPLAYFNQLRVIKTQIYSK